MGESLLIRKGGSVELTGTAVPGDVLNGKTFYSTNAETKLTGTLVPVVINETFRNFTVAAGQTITAGTFVDLLQGSLTFGSKSVLSSGDQFSADYSVASIGNNKIFVAFRDSSNGYRGTGIVGTISGTSISWGSKFIYQNTNTSNPQVVDLGNDKVFIAYFEGGNSYGYGIVGTISGTSISYGTRTTFQNDTSNTNFINLIKLSDSTVFITYSAGSSTALGYSRIATISGTSATYADQYQHSFNRTEYVTATKLSPTSIFIAHRNSSNNGISKIATISGTVISYGPDSNYLSGTIFYQSCVAVNATTVVIGYQNNSNSNHGNTKVGTISGTTITWGSQLTFNSGNTEYIDMQLFGTDKIIYVYTDQGNASKGTVVIGTISGTNITFGSEILFNNATSLYNTLFILPNSQLLITFMDGGSSNNGTAIIGTIPSGIINTTSQMVFGLAKTGGTAGQTIEVYVNE
jgi:hypothetical protein